MLQCYNKGCGQQFDPAKNTDDSCRHHPGEPFFHDAYKGWSCCNKKSVDFTEFLNIKGCTLGKHSNIQPPEREKPVKSKIVDDEVIVVRAPLREPMPRPAFETPMVTLKASVASALKETIDALKISTINSASAKTIVGSSGITIGTNCKNNGCSYSYTNTGSDFSECIYHPGVPIFHEGMKFWSCCQKRTSDFTQFMAQKGCAYGEHKWVKENENKKIVECRYDWHQTATNVIVAIYAKKYHYSQSQIKVNPIRLQAELVFPEQENSKFNLDLELRGIIDVHKATAQMYGTKVEITLPKLEPGSWQKLNFVRDNLNANKNGVATDSQKTQNDESEDEFFDFDDISYTQKYGVNVTELNSNNLD